MNGSDAESVDVVVLGMGPGGEDLAGRLAEAGLDVVGIDGRLLGGECPYWGCIPSKVMIRAANALAEARRVNELAGSAIVRPDFAPLARRIRSVTDNWDDAVAVTRFEATGGRFVRGFGHLDGPGRVVVGERAFLARRAVVLNTGAAPVAPPIPGLADSGYWTNRDAIETESVPVSLVCIGGGAVGVELSQVFARFGSHVTILEDGPGLLAAEEPEAGTMLRAVFEREGVEVVVDAAVSAVERRAGSFAVTVGGRVLEAEQLLVATRRRPDLGRLRVGSVGLDEAGASIAVDGHLRAAPGLWAIGDVTGVGAFTHVSMYQAGIARADILGEKGPPADYRALPRVTFTDPEIGSVGLSEAAARGAGLHVRVGSVELAKSSRGYIHGPGNDGFIKLVEDAERHVLVGATSAGPMGGEVLGLLSLAIHAEVPTDTLTRMITAYPTFHRAVEDALAALA